MSVTTLQQRRRDATRWFLLRVTLLIALTAGIAYAAWFAPWAKPARYVAVETAAETQTKAGMTK